MTKKRTVLWHLLLVGQQSFHKDHSRPLMLLQGSMKQQSRPKDHSQALGLLPRRMKWPGIQEEHSRPLMLLQGSMKQQSRPKDHSQALGLLPRRMKWPGIQEEHSRPLMLLQGSMKQQSPLKDHSQAPRLLWREQQGFQAKIPPALVDHPVNVYYLAQAFKVAITNLATVVTSMQAASVDICMTTELAQPTWYGMIMQNSVRINPPRVSDMKFKNGNLIIRKCHWHEVVNA